MTEGTVLTRTSLLLFTEHFVQDFHVLTHEFCHLPNLLFTILFNVITHVLEPYSLFC